MKKQKDDPLADLIYKVCGGTGDSGCGKKKKLSEYGVNNRNKDGRRRTCKACRRIVYSRFRHNHHAKLAHKEGIRRAGKQVPKWVNLKRVLTIYESAYNDERVVVVDHYYPLKGKEVSGLHTHENLVILTKEENLKKYNKHPDEFYKQET